MEQFYYYKFLQRQASERGAELLDLLKYELDQRIYYYGEHFKYPKEKNDSKQVARQILKEWYCRIKSYSIRHYKQDKKYIVSNAYFSVNSELSKLGFNVCKPSWTTTSFRDVAFPSTRFNLQTLKFFHKVNHATFADLLNDDFMKNDLESFITASKAAYQNHANALIVPNDLSMPEKIAIKAFKDVQKPSFIFLHGLPGRYNSLDDNRADYLIVWGEKIKEHYVNSGVPANKIFVSGHPYYQKLKSKKIRFSLENILVITKSMPGAQPCSDKYHLSERGNMILYLFSLQFVLQKLGVKSVRFRPHPSENGLWYLRYIDNKFYQLDNENLQDSLNKSSLIIGPTSTLALESIYHGVNYVIYEPVIDNKTLENMGLVPPFDGSDGRFPVAKNEEELYDTLKNQIKVDISIWEDYIKTPFDLSFMKTLV